MLSASAARMGSGMPLACSRSFRVKSSGTAVGLGPEDVGREPQVALALMGLHELADRLFEVLEHFDFRCEFARRVGGDAHVFPFTTVRLPRYNEKTSHETYSGWSRQRQRAAATGAYRGSAPSRFSIRDQLAVADVVLALEDTPPAQGAQEALRPLVVGPELGHVPAGLGRPLLERRQQPVGVAPMPLLRQDHHVHQMGHSAPEPVPQAPDPVPDLVAENEVMLVDGRPPSRWCRPPARAARRTRPRNPRPVPSLES